MSVVTGFFKSKETWTNQPSSKGKNMKMQRKSITSGLRLHEGVVPFTKPLQCYKGVSPWCHPCSSFALSPQSQIYPRFEIAPFKTPSPVTAAQLPWCGLARSRSPCPCIHRTHAGSFVFPRGIRGGPGGEETLLWVTQNAEGFRVVKVSSLLCLSRTKHLNTERSGRRNDVDLGGSYDRVNALF